MKFSDILRSVLSIIFGILVFVLFFTILSYSIIISIIIGGVVFLVSALLSRPKRKRPLTSGYITDVDEAPQDEKLREGFEKQQQLKQLKNRITKYEIREKVAKIIDVVDRIFDDFKKDPKDIREGRQFLNTYLDSTITIIEKYSDLSKSETKSEELQDALERTEALLDQINESFEVLLSKLLENDTLDLNVEIEVLEKTLKMEGLNKDQT